MLSAMSIAVVWGWFGIGGAVAMLFLALFAAGAGWISRDHWEEGSGWSQVGDSTSASVLMLIAVVLALASIASFWGAFRDRREQITIVRLHAESHRNSTDYRVEDDSGRDLVLNEDLYRRLHEGDIVECHIARPVLLPARLVSCAAPEP
jgi:hypothetical protein